MSIKKTLISNFFKISGKNTEKIVERNLKEGGARCLSSQSVKKVNHSRPSSVCSSKSSYLDRSQVIDRDLPEDLVQAIRKISIRTLLSYNKTGTDENSTCLIYAFLILIGFIDKDGPAFGIKNMRSKVLPTFNYYLRNSASLIQLIRKLPKVVRGIHNNSLYKKAVGLFKIVDHSKLTVYQDLYEYISCVLNYIDKCKEALIADRASVERPKARSKPQKKHQKSNSITSHPQNLKFKPFKTEIRGKYGLETLDISQVFNNSKAEKFLKESRLHKRIHEKLVMFSQDKQGQGEDFKQGLVKEFLSTLPCTEINRTTYKLAESYFKKMFG